MRSRSVEVERVGIGYPKDVRVVFDRYPQMSRGAARENVRKGARRPSREMGVAAYGATAGRLTGRATRSPLRLRVALQALQVHHHVITQSARHPAANIQQATAR